MRLLRHLPGQRSNALPGPTPNAAERPEYFRELALKGTPKAADQALKAARHCVEGKKYAKLRMEKALEAVRDPDMDLQELCNVTSSKRTALAATGSNPRLAALDDLLDDLAGMPSEINRYDAHTNPLAKALFYCATIKAPSRLAAGRVKECFGYASGLAAELETLSRDVRRLIDQGDAKGARERIGTFETNAQGQLAETIRSLKSAKQDNPSIGHRENDQCLALARQLEALQPVLYGELEKLADLTHEATPVDPAPPSLRSPETQTLPPADNPPAPMVGTQGLGLGGESANAIDQAVKLAFAKESARQLADELQKPVGEYRPGAELVAVKGQGNAGGKESFVGVGVASRRRLPALPGERRAQLANTKAALRAIVSRIQNNELLMKSGAVVVAVQELERDFIDNEKLTQVHAGEVLDKFNIIIAAVNEAGVQQVNEEIDEAFAVALKSSVTDTDLVKPVFEISGNGSKVANEISANARLANVGRSGLSLAPSRLQETIASLDSLYSKFGEWSEADRMEGKLTAEVQRRRH